MRLVRRALMFCAAAMVSSAAAATELVLLAPDEAAAPPAAFDPLILSPHALAVITILEQAIAAAGDPLERALLEEVRGAYESRDFRLLWADEGRPKWQALALRRRMELAAADGLDPTLYLTPPRPAGLPEDAVHVAGADVAFSLSVARYVTHLAAGRTRPADISRIITLEPERPDVSDALTGLSETGNIALGLSHYEPPHPEYRALKGALAWVNASAAAREDTVVPEGPSLRPGDTDPRVSALRPRLGVPSPAPGAAELYDDGLVEAVRAFQAGAGLKADGIVGRRTLAALNGPSPAEDIAAIIANMERWRWMPRELGAFHAFVNVPEYMVRVRRGREVVHETRVVVGAPHHRTPTFSHVMDHLVVNPFWHVPTSIVKNEMLAEIQADPAGYFADHGYQVLVKVGDKMQAVNPATIGWTTVDARNVRIRQVPGDGNALGRIKFMFPNQHSVYLHDTPSKSLFNRDYRAWSHGCVRVENPLEFADAILKVAAPDWDSVRIEKLYGGRERRIDLDTPIPVHLAYFTRTVDADGVLRRFEDIYGYDRKAAGQLSTPAGKVAGLSP